MQPDYAKSTLRKQWRKSASKKPSPLWGLTNRSRRLMRRLSEFNRRLSNCEAVRRLTTERDTAFDTAS